MSSRDVQTSNMLARDLVILLVSATTMVRNYLFTNSLVHCMTKEAKKCLRLSSIAMFLEDRFGKHC